MKADNAKFYCYIGCILAGLFCCSLVNAQELETRMLRLVFAGGKVDNNLTRVYRYLLEKGLLPKRSIEIRRGQNIEDFLKADRVLLDNYPNPKGELLTNFNELLRELNQENSDVIPPETPGEEIMWKGDKPRQLVVPDLKTRFKNFRTEKGILRGVEAQIPLAAVMGLSYDLGIGRPYGLQNVYFAPATTEGSGPPSRTPSKPGTVLQGGRRIAAGPLKSIAVPSLMWSARVEEEDDPHRPIKPLEANTSYRLTLHLSPFDYDGQVTSLKGILVKKFIEEWSAKHNQNLPPTIRLTAIVLVDTEYFEEVHERVGSFTISVEKMQNYNPETYETVPNVSVDFANATQGEGSLPYVFGELRTLDHSDPYFTITTKSVTEPGWGSVTVVLFDSDTENRPVGEVSFAFCIGGSCPESSPVTSKESFDPNTLGFGRPSSVDPDASLYLIELSRSVKGPYKLYGLFHTKKFGCANYCTWEVPEGYERFASFLAGKNNPQNEGWLKHIGESHDLEKLWLSAKDLTSKLFPCRDEKKSSAARQGVCEAKKALSQLVIEQQRNAQRPTPSLFVRVIQHGSDVPFVFPVGLLLVQGDQDEYQYVGRWVRVEMPLPWQTYESPKDCPTEWITVFPPPTLDLDDTQNISEEDRLALSKNA